MSSNESLISMCRILIQENEALRHERDELRQTVKRCQHGANMWRQFGHQLPAMARTMQAMGGFEEVSNRQEPTAKADGFPLKDYDHESRI